tara:strand:+ start:459 stop:707 length:249 start_codon:yes stop_codon:yes gene_type:complete
MYGTKNMEKKPPKKNMEKKPPKKTMEKKPPKKMKTLTPAQKKRLEKHSVHHSKKHMNMMKKDMMAGMTFKAAHEKAQKMVGK